MQLAVEMSTAAGTGPMRTYPLIRGEEIRRAGAAEQGRDSITPLVARKGRASYLGERSVGHQDPGATSMALLLRAAADSLVGHPGAPENS